MLYRWINWGLERLSPVQKTLGAKPCGSVLYAPLQQPRIWTTSFRIFSSFLPAILLPVKSVIPCLNKSSNQLDTHREPNLYEALHDLPQSSFLYYVPFISSIRQSNLYFLSLCLCINHFSISNINFPSLSKSTYWSKCRTSANTTKNYLYIKTIKSTVWKVVLFPY